MSEMAVERNIRPTHPEPLHLLKSSALRTAKAEYAAEKSSFVFIDVISGISPKFAKIE